MAKSAGILMYRHDEGNVRVLLVHPGGPFWQNKDQGAWSIPKGLIEEGEDAATAARREFSEELGSPAEGPLQPLGTIRQSGGKLVEAFGLEGDLDVGSITSGLFALEWPPHSGQIREFPEVDRAEWFTLQEARSKMLAGQHPFLDRLEAMLASGG